MKKNKVIELVIQWFIVVSGSSYRGKTSEKMFLRSVREERRKENMYYPEYLQKYRHLMKNTKSLETGLPFKLRAPSHRVLRVKALLCFFLSLCAHFCRHITHFLTFQDSMAHLLFFFLCVQFKTNDFSKKSLKNNPQNKLRLIWWTMIIITFHC